MLGRRHVTRTGPGLHRRLACAAICGLLGVHERPHVPLQRHDSELLLRLAGHVVRKLLLQLVADHRASRLHNLLEDLGLRRIPRHPTLLLLGLRRLRLLLGHSHPIGRASAATGHQDDPSVQDEGVLLAVRRHQGIDLRLRRILVALDDALEVLLSRTLQCHEVLLLLGRHRAGPCLLLLRALGLTVRLGLGLGSRCGRHRRRSLDSLGLGNLGLCGRRHTVDNAQVDEQLLCEEVNVRNSVCICDTAQCSREVQRDRLLDVRDSVAHLVD